MSFRHQILYFNFRLVYDTLFDLVNQSSVSSKQQGVSYTTMKIQTSPGVLHSKGNSSKPDFKALVMIFEKLTPSVLFESS